MVRHIGPLLEFLLLSLVVVFAQSRGAEKIIRRGELDSSSVCLVANCAICPAIIFKCARACRQLRCNRRPQSRAISKPKILPTVEESTEIDNISIENGASGWSNNSSEEVIKSTTIKPTTPEKEKKKPGSNQLKSTKKPTKVTASTAKPKRKIKPKPTRKPIKITNAYKHRKFTRCCFSCVPACARERMCRYDLEADDLNKMRNCDPFEHFPKVIDCASDHNDNTECCQKKGITDECIMFCKYKGLSHETDIMKKIKCLNVFEDIQACHMESVTFGPPKRCKKSKKKKS